MYSLIYSHRNHVQLKKQKETREIYIVGSEVSVFDKTSYTQLYTQYFLREVNLFFCQSSDRLVEWLKSTILIDAPVCNTLILLRPYLL